MLLAACSSTADFKEEAPSAGTAFVSIPAYLWVTHVDGNRLLWKQKSRHEIAAGPHELTINYDYNHNVAVGIKLNGMFEEGKSYYVLPKVGPTQLGVVFDTFTISCLLVENTDQPLMKIAVPQYKPSLLPSVLVSFSPVGSELLVTYGKMLYVYNTSDGTLAKTFPEHPANITVALWSPDGTKIITADGSSVIKIWDALSGNEIRSISGPRGSVLLWITPDGTRLLGNSGEILKIWDVESGRELASFDKLYQMFGFSFFNVSTDGNYFAATFGDNTTRVYPIDGGEPVLTIGGQKGKAYMVIELLDDNTLITSRSEGITPPKIVSIDVNSKKETVLGDHISRAYYNGDGSKAFPLTTAAGGGVYTFLRQVDIKTGNTEKAFTNPRVEIYALSVSPAENKVATFSRLDGNIRIWGY